MSDDNIPVIHFTLDEAPDPNAMSVGVDGAGRSVWTRVRTPRLGPERLADLIDQVKAGVPRLDRADYADRWARWGTRGGGKSSAIHAVVADLERRGVPAHVVDPALYLRDVTWPAAAGETLDQRIVRVIAEAEALVAEVRREQDADRVREQNRADLRRMFGDVR